MPTTKVSASTQRALYLWPHLVELAANKRRITFGALAARVNIPGAPLALIPSLNKLCAYCKRKALPQIPILVVGKSSGQPGKGTDKYPEVAAETEQVFAQDWTRVPGPALADLV